MGRGIALLFLTTALEGGGWSAARPGRTLPQERPGTHFTGGWVGPRAGLDGQKITPHRDSIPGRPARSQLLYRLSHPVHICLEDIGKTTKVSVRTGVPADNYTRHLKYMSRGAVIGRYSHLYKIRTHGHKK